MRMAATSARLAGSCGRMVPSLEGTMSWLAAAQDTASWAQEAVCPPSLYWDRSAPPVRVSPRYYRAKLWSITRSCWRVMLCSGPKEPSPVPAVTPWT